ncbi:hypothetical protein [Streptomyces sp. NBC_01264]|uniref:hypothetical protein n=1 Tax=Streptomyces sp. NBC_01264 TaxID=2903804 RepID=UPI002254E28E|nr:hypothetical protein [Streptomyces sp. NBC_01264]MCX4776800.1 hypothetical protein [Streptomyces sp. NBC_01264]
MRKPRFTEEEAKAELDQRGWVPLEDFPGTVNATWLMRCTTCSESHRRSLRRVVEGHGCRSCSFFLASPTRRKKIVQDAGFVPVVPAPQLSATPWRCRCTGCGNEVDVVVERIARGLGCSWCSGRWSPEELHSEMVWRGFDSPPHPPGSASPG